MLGYSAGQFGVGFLPLILLEWISYFYSPPEGTAFILISPLVFANIRMIERIAGAVIEPLIGYLSDRTKTRFGRRLPWMVFGLPFLIGSFVWIWFPPASTVTDDPRVLVHFGVLLMLFYAAYTAVVAPYGSMLPELTADDAERVRVSVWMSLFEVFSNVTAAIGAGMLIDVGAVSLGLIALGNGYELLGVVVGAIGFAAFLPVFFFVREPPRSAHHEVPFSLLRAAKESLNNPEFLPYSCAVAGFRFGTAAAIVGVPYIGTQLMGLSATEAGLMLAIIIIVAACAFPLVDKLAVRYGKARVFRWGGYGFIFTLPLMGTIGLGPLNPVVHGSILFVMAGFSTATLLVLPRALIADVIDLDQRRTGYRREAMYNGMSGVLEKIGEALGMGLVGYLGAWFGNSAAEPLGLRLIGAGGAIGVALGLLVFRRYSIE